MIGFSDLVQQSAGNAWLFVPSAVLLGALHGLEPGHSKTMMAAFIVAVRGTVKQAILLAVSATLSHTAIVWICALLALTYGKHWSAETNEPYLQIASGAIIVGMALWMMYRTWRDQQDSKLAARHHHHDERRRIDTGHGVVDLSIFEEGVPPRFRLHYLTAQGDAKPARERDVVSVETVRDDGVRQSFAFVCHGGYFESLDQIPEPHQFAATLSIGHGGHTHDFETRFVERSHGASLHTARNAADFEDAHQRAHSRDIRERLASQGAATTGQVIAFGLTGGLIPCPAAITVLLLCLQLHRFWLGIVLVLCFSIGLALTLTLSGVTAAWGTRHVVRRWKGLDAFTQRAPYFASILIICVGLYVGLRGLLAL